MKSKTSFFNRTVFKKNMTLYWPIWVCYLLYGMVKVPGQLWSRLQQQTDMTAYARDYALYNSLRLEVDVAAIAIMAVVCGMALFGYLFTQKNAYMIHALPVTRGELYVTNMISGLCFLLIPQALVFLVTVVLCLLQGIASVQFLGLWFLSVMGIAFFLYATVCFCVMFTGQLFALPVYFLAVNYVAFAFSSGARYVIGYLGYGLGMNTVPEFLILRILSPMNYLYNNVRFVFRQSYNQETDLMSGVLSYRGLRVLAAYVAAAVVIYLIAYYCYKKRRIESAGDLISFNWVKPLFRWGVGTGVGYFAGVFAAEFLDSVHLHVKKPMLLVLVVAFILTMIQTFRVIQLLLRAEMPIRSMTHYMTCWWHLVLSVFLLHRCLWKKDFAYFAAGDSVRAGYLCCLCWAVSGDAQKMPPIWNSMSRMQIR